MEKKTEEITKKKNADIHGKQISRKEAIKKAGFIAVSAATTMILLNSPAKACTSPAPPPPKPSNPPPGGGGGHHGPWH